MGANYHKLLTLRRYWAILLLLLLMVLIPNSNVAQINNAGPVISYQKTEGGITGKTSNTIFEIRAYSDQIIRVRLSRKGRLNDFSYALADTIIPVFKGVNIKDEKNNITISTHSVTVTVEKKPFFRLVIRNASGELISEDMPGDGFGTSFLGDKVTSTRVLQEGERFIGLGEALGNLDRRGSGVTLNNTDNYKYGDPRVPMYSSVPFFIGIHHRLIYGLFYNNSYPSWFNFGLSTSEFSSVSMAGGDLDYFFMTDNSVAKVIEHYTSLTGRMPVPPLWSLGYHQSRCSYYPQNKVVGIAETFRSKKIPVDCIVLDADYLQDYEPFRINTSRFPDMPGLTKTLLGMDLEVTASVNPGIKLDSSYEASADGIKNNVFLKYTSGRLFVAPIEPSINHFVDFTDPKGRAWWIGKMKFLPENGIHGYWNDMNEPAVVGSYLPDNIHFDFDGHGAITPEAKNVYGMLMARSSYESALAYGGGRRPFVLTRSGFAGVQRYAAMWSGDNQANDEHLLLGFLLNNQLGLSGIPFVGPDLGGYIGDGNKELYKRWIEAGVFSPYLRNHREFFGAASEPWAYGEEAEAISKTYIGFRYRLLPYIYSKFYETSQTGIPVARSLSLNFPFESRVYDVRYQSQFLFGDALLVVPVTSVEKVKKVFIPPGDWYDLFTDEKVEGNREVLQEIPSYQIPLYVKASSVIPMESLIQSSKQKPTDTLQLHLFYGREKNDFVYYEDDGNSFAYSGGVYCKRVISYLPAENQLLIGEKEGSYNSVFRVVRLIMHGFPESMTDLLLNGKWERVSEVTERMIDPLSDLEDYYDKNFMLKLKRERIKATQKTVTFLISEKAFKVQFN